MDSRARFCHNPDCPARGRPGPFTARRSPTGPLGLEVRASLDDFATSEVIALQALSDETINFGVTIGLVGFSFLQGVTDDVTFRIFGFGAEQSVGTFRSGID